MLGREDLDGPAEVAEGGEGFGAGDEGEGDGDLAVGEGELEAAEFRDAEVGGGGAGEDEGGFGGAAFEGPVAVLAEGVGEGHDEGGEGVLVVGEGADGCAGERAEQATGGAASGRGA